MTLPPNDSRLRRFCVYWLPAIALTMSLWTVPNIMAMMQGGLTAPPGVGDFALHTVAYVLVCFLWWRVFYTSPAARLSRWAVVLAIVASLLVGAIDEGIQAIPGLNRNSSWRDFLADIIGTVLAALLALEATRIARRRHRRRKPLSP